VKISFYMVHNVNP